MNKRGSSIMMIIFELLVVVMVVYLLTSIAHSYASSTLAAKVQAAEEISMMINTLVALPGDALIQYPKSSELFVFLANEQIVVHDPGAITDQTAAYRFFTLPKDYAAEGTVEKKSSICLEKKGKKITLRECVQTQKNE